MARYQAKFSSSFASLDGHFVAVFSGSTTALSNTRGMTLRAGLIESRSALSNAVLGQLGTENLKDGRSGSIVPYDVVTRSGGNYTFTSIYTSSLNDTTGIVRPASPGTRPTESIASTYGGITTANDGGTFSDSLFTAAATALEVVLDDIIAAPGNTTKRGPRYTITGSATATVGSDDEVLFRRGIHSIFMDYNDEYIAWDTIKPTNIAGTSLAGAPLTLPANANNDLILVIDAAYNGGYEVYVERLEIGEGGNREVWQYTGTNSGSVWTNGTLGITGNAINLPFRIKANQFTSGSTDLEFYVELTIRNTINDRGTTKTFFGDTFSQTYNNYFNFN